MCQTGWAINVTLLDFVANSPITQLLVEKLHLPFYFSSHFLTFLCLKTQIFFTPQHLFYYTSRTNVLELVVFVRRRQGVFLRCNTSARSTGFPCSASFQNFLFFSPSPLLPLCRPFCRFSYRRSTSTTKTTNI